MGYSQQEFSTTAVSLPPLLSNQEQRMLPATLPLSKVLQKGEPSTSSIQSTGQIIHFMQVALLMICQMMRRKRVPLLLEQRISLSATRKMWDILDLLVETISVVLKTPQTKLLS